MLVFFGVHGQETQKISIQVQKEIGKANGISEFLERRMSYHNSRILLHLCRGLLRPHMEYSVQLQSSI